MAKKDNTPKPQTENINPPQTPKSKRQIGQYDKIFQENLAKLLPHLIKKVLGMDIVHREQLPTRVQHTQERAPDILERVQLRDGRKKALHIEVQLKDEQDMNFRLADYCIMLLRIDPNTPIEQYVVYLGNEKPKHITGSFENNNMTFRYNVISFSDIPYEILLESDIPEIIVFAILGDLGKSTAQDVAIAAAQRINALEEGELKKKKLFKQLRIISNIRNLAPLIDKVMENITQYFVPERDPWYNKGFQLGEEKGEERGKKLGKELGQEKKNRDFTARLLLKTDHSDDLIAILVDVSVEYVEAIKKEVSQIQALLAAKNSVTKTAQLVGVPYDYVKKIKDVLNKA